MKVRLQPVYSRLAETVPEELSTRLPLGWRLSQHQVETYQALTNDDVEVIFNTALTGDGKSLAGQLPILARGGINYPILAMYPTNELIEDQQAQVERAIKTWNANVEYRWLNKAALDQAMAEDDYTRRGEALMRIIRNGDLVLTNPDIFHYVMHQFYTYPDDAPDRYAAPLAQKFSQLTFDEFHVFDVPQVISVLNALLFIQETSGIARPHKFLFLSATPSPLMREYLERSGLRVKFIEGQYATHGEPAHWRRILNPVAVHFVAAQRAEDWIEQSADDLVLRFFLDRRPHAKGAIIVNSVGSALRIYHKLKPLFETHGLSVGLNIGLTSRHSRRASYEADLLVGTSTVDIGVDFRINFLIFESHSAGSFIQRLGRLGRHSDYQRGGQTFAFCDYVAYAVLPAWLIERLFNSQGESPAPLTAGAELDRQQFNEAIRSAFPPVAEFAQYAQTWGKFQSLKILLGLSRKTIREQYQQQRATLQKRYEATFGVRLSSAIPQYKELVGQRSPLLEEALSFRGSSSLVCGVIDPSESRQADCFKVMDLLQAIANYELAYVSEEDFYRAVSQAGLNPKIFQDNSPLGFFRLGQPKEFQAYQFWLDKDVGHWSADQFGRAQAIKGLHIDASFPGCDEVNNRLSRRTLPALLCAGMHPLEMKRRLALPLLFPLYSFTSRDNVGGTIALERAALLLDARLRYHPLQCGGSAVIV